MPKVNDLKAYFKEIAVKAGLDEARIKQVGELIDDEKFVTAMNQNFKPLPDYSHDLDEVRAKTRQEKDAEQASWYQKEQQKYNEYVAGLNELTQYRTNFGPLDGNGMNNNGNNGNSNSNSNQNGNYLTKEQMEAALAEQLSRRDQTYLEYLELREDHMQRFGKPLDRRSFEAAYKEHPEWGSIGQAYKNFVEPEMERTREERYKAEAEKRYQQGLIDGRSGRQLPVDSRPKDFSVMFDQKADVQKMSPQEQERHSRAAFFEGLNEKPST